MNGIDRIAIFFSNQLSEEEDGHENTDMSPAANAISDELTLAGSLRACEVGLVSRYTAKYPSTAQRLKPSFD